MLGLGQDMWDIRAYGPLKYFQELTNFVTTLGQFSLPILNLYCNQVNANIAANKNAKTMLIFDQF